MVTDLRISKNMDFPKEEKKIFQPGSLLQTSVRTKLMTAGGHYRDEKVIASTLL